MFHWGKWKKRMGANSSSKRPVFDEKEDGKSCTKSANAKAGEYESIRRKLSCSAHAVCFMST